MQDKQRVLDITFVVLMTLLQIGIIILFAFYYRHTRPGETENYSQIEKNFDKYPYFIDMHIMIFIGFGFLLSCFHKGRLHFIATCFWVAALCLQLFFLASTIFRNISKEFSGEKTQPAVFNINNLIGATGCAASQLIALCCIIGKGNNLQYLIMAFFGVILFAVNSLFVTDNSYLGCREIGGSMVVHTFGAAYGIGLTILLNYPNSKNKVNLYGNQNTYVTGILGTLFFWCFWPSSNSAMANSLVERQIAIVNTYFSLIASAITSYMFSIIYHGGKFDMDHILAGSIAGGVIIGTNADLVYDGYVAFILGAIAALICCSLSTYSRGFLKWMGAHDVAGAFDLHLVPGFVGGMLSAIFRQVYIDDRGWAQAVGTLISLGIGLLGGLIVGISVRGCHYELDKNQYYNDLHYVVMDKYVTADLVNYGPPGYVDEEPSVVSLLTQELNTSNNIEMGRKFDGHFDIPLPKVAAANGIQQLPTASVTDPNNNPYNTIRGNHSTVKHNSLLHGHSNTNGNPFQPQTNGYNNLNSQPISNSMFSRPSTARQGYAVNPAYQGQQQIANPTSFSYVRPF